MEKLIKNISLLTDRNQHTESVIRLAEYLKEELYINILKKILELHILIGYMPHKLIEYRSEILHNLFKILEEKEGKHIKDKIYQCFLISKRIN